MHYFENHSKMKTLWSKKKKIREYRQQERLNEMPESLLIEELDSIQKQR